MKLKRFISSILLSSTVLQSLHVPFAIAVHDEERKVSSTSAKLNMTPDQFRELIPALYQSVVDSEGNEAAERHLQELCTPEPRKFTTKRSHRCHRAGRKHRNHDRPLSETEPTITTPPPPSEPVKEEAPLLAEVVAAGSSEPIASSEMLPAVEHNGKRRMSKAERDRLKKEQERLKKAAAHEKSQEELKTRKEQEAHRLAEEQKRQDEELRRLELESQQAREESERQTTAKPTYELILTTLNTAFAETNIDRRYAQFAQAGSAFADLKDDERAQAKVLLLLLTGLWKPEGQYKGQTFLQRHLNQTLRTIFEDQFQDGIAKFLDPHSKIALAEIENDPHFAEQKEALIRTLDPNAPSQENIIQIELMLYNLYRENPLAKKSDEYHQSFISKYRDNPDILTSYGLLLWGTPVADFLDISLFYRTPDQMIRGFEVLVNVLSTYHHPLAYDVVSRFINILDNESFYDRLGMVQDLKAVLRRLLESRGIAEKAAKQGSLEAAFKLGRLQLDEHNIESAWNTWKELVDKGHLASVLFIYKANFVENLNIPTGHTLDQLEDIILKTLKHPTGHTLRREAYQVLMEIELRKIAIAQTEEEIQDHLHKMKAHFAASIAYFKDFPVADQIENFTIYLRDLNATFKKFNFQEDDDKLHAFNEFLHYTNWAIYNLAKELKAKKTQRHVRDQTDENSVARMFSSIQTFPLARYYMAETLLENSLGQQGFYEKMLALLQPILNAKAESYCVEGNDEQKTEFESVRKKAFELTELLRESEDVLTERPHHQYIDESTEHPTQFETSELEKQARASTNAPERARLFWAAFNNYIEKGEGTPEYIRALGLYQMGEIHGEIEFVERMDATIKPFIKSAMAQHGQIIKRLLEVDKERVQKLKKIFKEKKPETRNRLLVGLRASIDEVIQQAKAFCELYSLNPNYQYLQGTWLIEHYMKEMARVMRALGLDPANPPSELEVETQNYFAKIYGALNQGVTSLQNAIKAGMVEAHAFVMTHPLVNKQFPNLNVNKLDPIGKNFPNMDDVIPWYEEHSAMTPKNIDEMIAAGIPDYIGGFAVHTLTRPETHFLLGENPENCLRELLLESAQKGSFKAFESLVIHHDKPIIKGHISGDRIRELGKGLLKVPGIQGLPSLLILAAKAQTLEKNTLDDADRKIIAEQLNKARLKLGTIVPRSFVSQKTYYYEMLLFVLDEMNLKFSEQGSAESEIGKVHAQTIWQIIKESDDIIDRHLPYFNEDINQWAVIDLDQESPDSQFQIKYARELLEVICKGRTKNAIAHLKLARLKRLAFGDSDPEKFDEAEHYYEEALTRTYAYTAADDNEALMRTSLSIGVGGEYTLFQKLRRQYERLPG